MTAMVKKEKLYSVGEVANLFNVARSTVYRYIDFGELTAYKVFGQIRIKGEDLQFICKKIGV